MLATDVILCEDGHAQERSLLDQVLEIVRPRTSGSPTATSARPTSSSGSPPRGVLRHPPARLDAALGVRGQAAGVRPDRDRQGVRADGPATNDAGEILFLRRVTVVLDKPTRDGDAEIHLLTNVPAKDAHGEVGRRFVPRRWTIETAFQELEATLNGEINTLGYPKAALFAFCVALVAYNVLSTVKAALRSVHGEEVVAEEVSGYYVADEIQMTHGGMMIAIPEDEWVVFHDLTPEEMAAVLVGLAATWLAPYQSTRGPKKPKPEKQSGAKIKHVATAKILKARQKRTK